MGVASGCGKQEVGVASGSGWNLWVWLVGVVVRRYIFPHTTSLLLLYLFFFTAASLLFVHFLNVFRSCIICTGNHGWFRDARVTMASMHGYSDKGVDSK